MTEKRKEIHRSFNSIEECKYEADIYISSLERKEIVYKCNKYYFQDGNTHKGYKVITFNSKEPIIVFKVNKLNQGVKENQKTKSTHLNFEPVKKQTILTKIKNFLKW